MNLTAACIAKLYHDQSKYKNSWIRSPLLLSCSYISEESPKSPVIYWLYSLLCRFFFFFLTSSQALHGYLIKSGISFYSESGETEEGKLQPLRKRFLSNSATIKNVIRFQANGGSASMTNTRSCSNTPRFCISAVLIVKQREMQVSRK